MSEKKKKELTQWEMFHGLWQTCFPIIKGETVIFWWEKFCNEADWNMLEETFMLLEGQHKTKKQNGINTYPLKLSDVKDVYYSLRDKKHAMNYDDQGECICCKGCGYVTIVQRDDGKGWKLCDPNKVIYAKEEVKMGLFSGPCTCRLGPQNVKYEYRKDCVQNRFGCPMDGTDREKAEEYIEKCRNAKHTPDMIKEPPVMPENNEWANNKALNGNVPDKFQDPVQSVSESLVCNPEEQKGGHYQ